MKRSSKIAIAAVAVVVAIPLILLLAAEVIVNSTAIKPEIEKTVSQILEMDFKIQGRIDIRLLPLISLAANDLTVKMNAGQIASADRIIIDPLLRPLWRREVQIEEVRIDGARLNFDPHAIDKIMALGGKETDTPLPLVSLAIDSFAIADGGFKYTDGKTLLDFNDINFRGDRIEIIKNREVVIKDVFQFLKSVSFSGKLAARQISSRDFQLENVSAELKNKNGMLSGDPIALQYLGSESKLRASLDLRQAKPKFESSVNLSGLSLKALAAKILPAAKIGGNVNCTADVSADGIQLESLADYLSKASKPAAPKKIPIESVQVENFTVAGKDITYASETVTIDKLILNLKGDRWALIQNHRTALSDFDGFLRATKLTANASINRLTAPDQLFENIEGKFTNNHGVLNADAIKLRYFGERAEIGLKWNLKEKTEHVWLRVEMPEQKARQLLKKSNDVDLLEGILNIKAEFKSSGTDWGALAKNISGHVILKGSNMILHDVDLDKALDQFQKMGAYGFNDLFGLLTLGPLGTVVTQGYDQLESLEKMMAAEGNSRIQQIVSDWNVVRGVAHAKDVAFSTARHRVAIEGRLDFLNQRFGNVIIAAVDAKGCIVNKEVLDGPFAKPEVEEVGVVQRTLVRPLKKFLATKCDKPFYTGSVNHPPTDPGKK
jgi:uncharacterized protein involved in outer membrane biogenesis